MNAFPEKSSPSTQASAPLAPSTKKNKLAVRKKPKLSKARKQLDYIVRKFVQPSQINWQRDLKVLRENLLKVYPEFAFWYSLPAPFQMNGMHGFLTTKAAKFLKLQYAKFNLQIPEREPIILSPEPLVQPMVYKTHKPTSILEFCR